MKIVLLTRTSRPSGALIAESLIAHKKDLVAIVAEERSQLLGKGKSRLTLLLDSFKKYGFEFTQERLLEALNIKLHFFLRKILGSKIYYCDKYLSIEEFVLSHKVPYFVVKDHNSQETEKLIRGFSPDLLAITNTRVIRKNILDIPKLGALNLHLSELPKYAGLNSIFWALFKAEEEIGVTVHLAAETLDRGDILLQKKIKVEPKDNEKTLYQKALSLGAEMMPEVITLIEQNKARPIKQDKNLASYFTWPTKEERLILKQKLKMQHKAKRNSPIKVLHIITRLVKGGAQENTLITVLGLRDRGYDVMLASGPSFGPEGEIESRARAMGVNIVIIPELVRPISPLEDLVSFFKIFNLIRQNHFDIVHTHTSKAGIVGRLAAKLSGVPVIVHTPHGHIFHSYFGEIKTRFLHILEIVSAHFCDKIITLTDKCKEEHLSLKIGSPEKFITIPSGVRLEKFLNCSFDIGKLKSQLNIPVTRKIVGTVARLEPVKGVNFIIEAMPLILQAIPQVHFLIVGDGSQRKSLEEKTRELKDKNCITFAGIREDIPELMAIMDVFVLASLNEGMGRVLVEAGVMAKPIVATQVSGIPELVKHNKSGILVEPRNPKQLAQGIIDLISDATKAKRLGENAKARMVNNFSAQVMVEKIDNLYKELLASKCLRRV